MLIVIKSKVWFNLVYVSAAIWDEIILRGCYYVAVWKEGVLTRLQRDRKTEANRYPEMGHIVGDNRQDAIIVVSMASE